MALPAAANLRLTWESEDSSGRVLERLLLPRPTEDPRDPLVSFP